MAKIAPYGKFTAIADGIIYPLAKLYTYEAGTTTPKATYVDQAETASNANPVIMDADGQANVWLGAGAYKFILKDANDNTLWTTDDITGDVSPTFGATVPSVSASTVIDLTYQNSCIVASGTITLSLLPAASSGSGFYFCVRNNGVGTVTIDPDGAETINGASTLALTAGETALVICNGTAWFSFFYSDLGTAAAYNIGTSGATIPLNNGNNTFSGTNTLSGVNTFTAVPVIQLTSTDSGYEAQRLGASANGNVINKILSRALNSSSVLSEYGQIESYISSNTAGAQTGGFRIRNRITTTLTTVADFVSGLVLGAATGGDKGTGTINATEFYVNGLKNAQTPAFVNFNGTGTVAINSSLNVTSITDNGTGDYTVNFTTALASANYSAVFGCRGSTGGAIFTVQENASTATRTTTALRLAAFQNGVGAADLPVISVTINI